MKTIGLIGGMSWVSTADYYRYINDFVQVRLGGVSSAEILLHSLNFDPIEKLQAVGDWQAMGELLADSANRLQRAGADCVLICTNTMHKVVPVVEAAINVPLIHIADATAAAVKRASIHTVALLGTRYTMEQPFIRRRLEENGLQVDIPNPTEREIIHDIIYSELVKNRFTDESRAAYVHIIESLYARGAEAMILACTEIPMLVKQTDTNVPLFDPTYLHAEAAVDFSLGTEE